MEVEFVLKLLLANAMPRVSFVPRLLSVARGNSQSSRGKLISYLGAW